MVRIVTVLDKQGNLTRCVPGMWSHDFMAWVASKGCSSKLEGVPIMPERDGTEMNRAIKIVAQFLMDTSNLPGAERLSVGPL